MEIIRSEKRIQPWIQNSRRMGEVARDRRLLAFLIGTGATVLCIHRDERGENRCLFVLTTPEDVDECMRHRGSHMFFEAINDARRQERFPGESISKQFRPCETGYQH